MSVKAIIEYNTWESEFISEYPYHLKTFISFEEFNSIVEQSNEYIKYYDRCPLCRTLGLILFQIIFGGVLLCAVITFAMLKILYAVIAVIAGGFIVYCVLFLLILAGVREYKWRMLNRLSLYLEKLNESKFLQRGVKLQLNKRRGKVCIEILVGKELNEDDEEALYYQHEYTENYLRRLL